MTLDLTLLANAIHRLQDLDVVDWATTGESFHKIIECDEVAVQNAG